MLTSAVSELCRTSGGGEGASLTRARHATHLRAAADHLRSYLSEDDQGSLEVDAAIAAQHLRRALAEVGAIGGKVSSEQILDVIFADFCIGK